MNLTKRSYRDPDFPIVSLNISSYDCKQERYTLEFDCNYNNAIEILFSDLTGGNIFQFSGLVAGKPYHVCFLIKNKIYYLFRGYTINSLVGVSTHSSKMSDGKLILVLVSTGEKYTSLSNLTGMFNYTGHPGTEPVVANWNKRAGDVVSLTRFSEETEETPERTKSCAEETHIKSNGSVKEETSSQVYIENDSSGEEENSIQNSRSEEEVNSQEVVILSSSEQEETSSVVSIKSSQTEEINSYQD